MNIKTFCFNPFQENTYVVSDESGECMIIDCGAFYDSERKALTDYIDGNDLKPVMLVATHAHLDHNFGNDLITSRYGIHPWVSAKDEVLMSGLDRQSMLFLNSPLKHPQPSVGRYFADNEEIVFGQHTFKVIPTPGHTPGSVFLYCQEEQLAFSGDTLFHMSIGRTDFELGSYDDIIHSLQTIGELLHDNTRIYCGHGPATTIRQEKDCNPYI